MKHPSGYLLVTVILGAACACVAAALRQEYKKHRNPEKRTHDFLLETISPSEYRERLRREEERRRQDELLYREIFGQGSDADNPAFF